MRTSIYSVLFAFCLASVCPAAPSAPAAPSPAGSAVVRLAPDFTIPGPGPKPRTLRSLRGQSVVLLFGKSAKTGALKKQVKYLQELFEQFASKGTIFAVALRQEDAPVQSNMPIAVVNDGAAVAEAYGVKKDFSIAVIGRDGNLDYITDKVIMPERIRDVVQNSFPVQASLRNK